MPFLWNKGVLHKHLWKCPKCGAEIEFNDKQWVYEEIKAHKKYCRGEKNGV